MRELPYANFRPSSRPFVVDLKSCTRVQRILVCQLSLKVGRYQESCSSDINRVQYTQTKKEMNKERKARTLPSCALILL